jgi:hypothetical protein
MSSFTRQVRDWLSGSSRRAELDRLSKFDLNRIAGDARVSIGELYTLTGRSPNAAPLLPRRMRALGIDEASLAHDEPGTCRTCSAFALSATAVAGANAISTAISKAQVGRRTARTRQPFARCAEAT